MLDFYTITTSVDLNDSSMLDKVLKSVGVFTQPLIIGKPFDQDGFDVLRFAVRSDTLAGREADLLQEIVSHDSAFEGKTEVVLATQL